jgi:ABC-type polysaccharide/polyol phosphate transport system ATPase subunit
MAAAITVEGLGKQYVLGRRAGYDTLRDTLANAGGRLRSAAKGGTASRRAADRLWALRDVSFEIEQGEVVGIIGPNGAGKSTLLKVLSRITEPTTGRARIRGRVGSLLEVGTGFHPELTGRENIYLNGAILGMTRVDITHRFDDIVDFAEIDRFLDTPVKHYSDGMYLRLAFAVAAHLEPEILLIDEILAVGDARFQRKCLGKMADISEQGGRTVVVVSHNMGLVQRLCQWTLLMEGGRLATAGPTNEVVGRYLGGDVRAAIPGQSIDVSAAPRRGTGEARFVSARYTSGSEAAGFQSYPDGPFEIVLELDSEGARSVPSFGVVFSDRYGTKLVNADILSTGVELELTPGRNAIALRIDQLHLNPGVYDVTLWIGDTVGVGYDLVEPAFQVDVVAQEATGFGVTPGSEYGSVTCRVEVRRL